MRVAALRGGLKMRQLGPDDGIVDAGSLRSKARGPMPRRIDDGDGRAAHDSQPFCRSYRGCAARLRRAEARRRANRRAQRPASSRCSSHSGPKRFCSHSRRRLAKPGARPPVETVSIKLAPAHDRRNMEIAKLGHVLDIDQHAARSRPPRQLGRHGRQDRQRKARRGNAKPHRCSSQPR